MRLRALIANRRCTPLLIVAPVLAALAAGCSSFVSAPTASQQNVIGPIAVTSKICLDGFGGNETPSGPPPGPFASSCGTPPAALATGTVPGSSPSRVDTAGAQGQLLIGYLIPDGTIAPTELTSPQLRGVTFSSSSQYVSGLNTTTAPPAGFHWVGYVSSEFTVSQALGIDLTADFTPPAAGGAFTVEEVAAGDRADGSFNGATLDPQRAILCSESSVDTGGQQLYPTGCVNDSSTTPLTVTPRALAVSPPPRPAGARAGATVRIPFTVRYTGAKAAFVASASATGRGTTAEPSTPDLTLTGTFTSTETVAVKLPGTLRAGTYRVTLAVRATGSGCSSTVQCTRSATEAIRVTGLRPAIAAVRLSQPKLRLTFRLNVASSVKLTLEAPRGKGFGKLRSVTRRVGQGHDTLSLRRLFGGPLATPGRYRLLIQAANNTLKSKPRKITFTTR